MYYVTTELYHHGILGMKWGKRNGPPYPLAARDHSKSEQKAGWKKSLSDSSEEVKKEHKQKEPGKYTQRLADSFATDYEMHYGGAYSKEKAKQAGMDKAKIMKRVAIGAGVVVGVGIAAYVYREYGREFADGLIRSGETLQTLSVDPERMNKGLSFYTAFTDADKASYMSFFSQDGYGQNKEIIQALVNKDIRIAGSSTGKKVFDQLMKSNSHFASVVENAIDTDWSHMPFVRNDYEKYNVLLVRNEYDDAHKIFYDALKDLGYGAVADVNDRYNPDLKTYAAIIFDRSNIMQTNVSHITDSMISAAHAKEIQRVIGNILFTPLNVAIAGGSAVGIAASVADKRNYKKYANKNSK